MQVYMKAVLSSHIMFMYLCADGAQTEAERKQQITQ